MANAPRDGNNVPALLITSNGTAVPAAGDALGRLLVASSAPVNVGGQSTVEIGIVASKVADANPARLGILLVNNGAADCYIGMSADVVSGSVAAAKGGALLKPGGAFSLSTGDGYTGELHAITAAGTTILAVMEW